MSLRKGYGDIADKVARAKGRATATDTSDTLLIAAPGAGSKIWISKLTVSNSHATTNTRIHLKSGSTIIWTTPAPAAGGAIEPFPDPIDCADNEALNFAAQDGVTTITVSVAGFIARTAR